MTTRILIADDDSTSSLILSTPLSNAFDVKTVESGQACINAAKRDLPDVILLDVEMPEFNGYEVCRILKSEYETSKIPVIFVSSHDDVDEILKGYEVGGFDFIIKPPEPKVIEAKVNLAKQFTDEREKMANDMASVTSTAMTAMNTAGELGMVIQFLDKCQSVFDLDELGKLLLDTFDMFGVTALVDMYHDGHRIEFGHARGENPIESDLLYKIRNKGRFYEFSTNLIINFSSLSILFKNMPLADSDRCGRLRDHFALLMNGANTKIESIERQSASFDEKMERIKDLMNLSFKKMMEFMDDYEQKASTQKANVMKEIKQLGKAANSPEATQETLKSLCEKQMFHLEELVHASQEQKAQLSSIKRDLFERIYEVN